MPTETKDFDGYQSEALSYKQIVHKIIYDPGYAKEIADLVRAARNGDAEATAEIARRFHPRPDELDDLHISPGMLTCNTENRNLTKTNPTGILLIDFARMY